VKSGPQAREPDLPADLPGDTGGTGEGPQGDSLMAVLRFSSLALQSSGTNAA